MAAHSGSKGVRAGSAVSRPYGPSQIVVALSLEFRDDLTTSQIEVAIERIETRMRTSYRQLVFLFVKPQKPAVWEARRALLDD